MRNRRAATIGAALCALLWPSLAQPTAPPSTAGNLLANPVGDAAMPAPPWRVVSLPKQTIPVTQYRIVELPAAGRVLQVEADASYGNLVHEWPAPVTAQRLAWRWRIEVDNPHTDLRRKAGDDHAAAVCVLAEMPLAAVPFWERQLLRLARALSGEALPAATWCYAWDARQAADTALDSPYTRRVRWLVLRGADDALGSWRAESRDLKSDFARLFGDESSELPPLRALLVAGDADNTRGRSVAQIADLVLQ